MRVLAQNGILSITAGDWEGQRIACIDVCGGKLHLAVGAPRFARLSGAALLPVFTVRDADQQTIRVIIEPALAVPSGVETDDALQRAAQAFGHLLESMSDDIRPNGATGRDWSCRDRTQDAGRIADDTRLSSASLMVVRSRRFGAQAREGLECRGRCADRRSRGCGCGRAQGDRPRHRSRRNRGGGPRQDGRLDPNQRDRHRARRRRHRAHVPLPA